MKYVVIECYLNGRKDDLTSNERVTTTIKIRSKIVAIKITRGKFDEDMIVGNGIIVLENGIEVVFIFMVLNKIKAASVVFVNIFDNERI